MYELTLGSIPNDWKYLLRTETSQKSFLKIFCYNINNKVARKVKDFQDSLIEKFTLPFNLIQVVIVLNTTFQIYLMDKLPCRTPYSQS